MEWQLPEWVAEGFVKDEMAAQMLTTWPDERWLRRGIAPLAGHRLYMQLDYKLRDDHAPAAHGGGPSHAQLYRGWARMTGVISEVLPRAPVGVFAVMPGDVPQHSVEELVEMRAQLPKLGPSFLAACPCGVKHTRALSLSVDGALHGDRVRGAIELSCDDKGRLEPQLAGAWDVELVYKDDKECGWCLCEMKRADEAGERLLRRSYTANTSGSVCAQHQHSM